MTLLYAALVYMLGLGLAHWWFDATGTLCQGDNQAWLLPLALLPLAHWAAQLAPRRPPPPMRWPQEAGFEPPKGGIAPATAASLALCLAAGCLRYAGQPFTRCWTAGDVAFYNQPPAAAFARSAAPVTLQGSIDSYPVVVDGEQEFVMAAASLQKNGGTYPVQGRVQITTKNERLRYGDQVSVTGRLVEPPVFDDFSFRRYLAIKGIDSLMYRAQVRSLEAAPAQSPLLRRLYLWREQGEMLIDRSLPEPHAALANGMLLGIKAKIPADLYEQFNTTATSHVIVISGTNVALISTIIIAVATRLLGRRGAFWAALGAIACYALLVGGEASVMRASIMGALFVAATALRRRSTALVSLAAACMAMTMVNPLALWDLGLQLSAVASAGLILLMPAAGRWMQRLFGKGHSWLRVAIEDILAVSLIASVSILPLVLYNFGRLSLVGVLSNLLIAPVQPLILFGGSAALLVGIIGQQACAQVLFWLSWLGLAWTVAVVRWSAALPLAAVNVPNFSLLHLALAYGAIGVVRWRHALWDRMRTAAGALLVTPAALAVGIAVTVLVWMGVLAQPDGRLHVWFLDVGQGDGIFIQTPSGRQVLIDGGASEQVLLGELGSVMPFWDRALDLLVLTHPDADHMAAQVEAASRYHIGAAWETPAAEFDPSSSAWRKAVETAGAGVQIQYAGGWADLGDGVALWVLGPPANAYKGEDADNENSLVARLVFGDFSVLLTGDAGAAAEGSLLAQGGALASTVLKVAHHGSDFSTSDALIQAVNPQLAIIQVGADNTYGHPDPQTLDRLAGRTILRTDRHGRIQLVSDGTRMWVAVENARANRGLSAAGGRGH